MCSFQSLKQAHSRQGSRAYDVGVTKGERKMRMHRGEEKAKQNTCHKLI